MEGERDHCLLQGGVFKQAMEDAGMLGRGEKRGFV